ncbi:MULTISPECIES: DUF6086 family protein [Actinosynnema]|uniref:DUF6086 family protein n=1 Tax=Actinosynnema TaxID=40566 RepID=UPI0020A51D10|nr:DUF6086 family protein [Actinosynnema pretiosum]
MDSVALGAFATALVGRYRDTGHAVIRSLSLGFTATVVVLAERAGVSVDRSAPVSGLEGKRDVQVPLVGGIDELWSLVAELERRMPC